MIGALIDKSSKVFNNFNNKIISTCDNSMEQITNETTKAIKSCEDMKVNAKKRFDSYYNIYKFSNNTYFINNFKLFIIYKKIIRKETKLNNILGHMP